MMSNQIGHNGCPEPTQRNFKKRWAYAIFDCQGTKSRPKPDGAIAMAFKLYMTMDANGRGAVISNEEFVVCCGVSDRSARLFKKWLYEFGFVQLVTRGYRGGASEFIATIPDEIPAAVAAINSQIPATNTGNNAEYRQPIPVIEAGLSATTAAINSQIPATTAAINSQIPATTAAIGELAATHAGIPSSASRAEVINNNNYNNNNNYLEKNNTKQRSNLEPARATPSPAAALPNKIDCKELEVKLLAACNGALADPVNCLGLLSLATPQMWIAEGCDLELDILPVLTAAGKKHHGNGIRTWTYFNGMVAEAKARRLAGLPTVTLQKPNRPKKASRWGRYAP